MDNVTNIFLKSQTLTDAYHKMNEKGRDILDKTISKLDKMTSESQKIKELVLNGANNDA